ncbi:hypothetical protein DdX_14042 [Ditylenchus destructor]|uniref:F-box domain-containing protein n=1 Tax=Ditylenchus destructor TaxID=166010 RepID=A0AAD4R237_9BILA|nr:hypothetical protein DdX_14042 [Ditylenchus destructor]
MRRSVGLSEMQANLEKEGHKGPNANKDRSKENTSNIATMDNGTMVEAFKYLNYCQLAKNSLVSKRFRNLIQTHRHSLALLYVDTIVMYSNSSELSVIKTFGKKLSPKAYNEWVIRNKYSKQAPIEDQVASSQNMPSGYRLSAHAHSKDLNNGEGSDRITAFFAEVEVNHENWPVFQHFVRLATDPFIYIDNMNLTPQTDVLNMLAGSINSDRLQCKGLIFILNGNSQESFTWAKDHVRCNQFSIHGKADLNEDEAFLDLFMTAGQCTSSVYVDFDDIFKAVLDFVQKFLDLENWDEYRGVLSIEGIEVLNDQNIEVLENDNAKFFVKEEHDEDDDNTELVFEFTNNAIGKKLQLFVTIFDNEDAAIYSASHGFSLKITNL